MKKAIVIDGYHRGYCLLVSSLYPDIKLCVEPKIGLGNIKLDDPSIATMMTEYKIYRVAFRSIDGEMALYSVDGSGESFLKFANWICLEEKIQPTYPMFILDRRLGAELEKGESK